MKLIFFFTMLSSILIFCQPKRSEIIYSDEFSITLPGNYYFIKDSLNFSIVIKNNLLSYSVINFNNDTIIQSKKELSSLHRWFMFWDEKRSLWVYSGDMGAFLWKLNDSGNYCEYTLIFYGYLLDDAPEILKKQIPESFYQIMKKYENSNKPVPIGFGIECID